MGGGRVLEVVALVDHEARVRGQHRGVAPVARRAPHREVGQQQMVIDDDDVGLRRFLARLEQKALLVHRAARALAEVRLGRDFVPDLGARRDRQIAQRSVVRPLGPRVNRVELLLQCRPRTARCPTRAPARDARDRDSCAIP